MADIYIYFSKGTGEGLAVYCVTYVPFYIYPMMELFRRANRVLLRLVGFGTRGVGSAGGETPGGACI